MNKKQYLEAQRELREEFKIERKKNFEAIAMSIRVAFWIMVYVFYFSLRKYAPQLNDPLFMWAVGFGTMLNISILFDYIKDKKEVKNARQK